MAAELVAESKRAFEVEAGAFFPETRRAPASRLAGDVHREPVLALVDDGQANARAGDRCAQIDGRQIVAARDPEAQVAPLLRRDDSAHICDDSGKHQSRARS